MYLQSLQKPRCSVGLKQARALIRRAENKVEFLERQFHNEKLSFVLKKETENSLHSLCPLCLLSAYCQS